MLAPRVAASGATSAPLVGDASTPLRVTGECVDSCDIAFLDHPGHTQPALRPHEGLGGMLVPRDLPANLITEQCRVRSPVRGEIGAEVPDIGGAEKSRQVRRRMLERQRPGERLEQLVQRSTDEVAG
jgi:hypothetical protein